MAEVGTVKYIARIDTSKLGADAKDAESKVSSVGDSNERAAERSTKSWSTFAKVGLAAVATAAIAVAAVITKNLGGAIDRVDTLNNAPKVLRNLGYDADASDKSIKRIASSLKGLPSRLNDVVSNQVAVASSTDFSIEKVTDLTLAFNNMALAGGKGAQEANRAFVQFTQGLGRGKFQAQDFNTLMEVMPAQLSQVAKSLLGPSANAVTLKNALSDGTVTNDMFVDSIIKLDKEGGKGFSSFAKQAKDATEGIKTGMDNFGAAVQRGISSVLIAIGSKNISDALSNFGGYFESSLKWMGEVLPGIITNVRNLATSVGDYLGPKLKSLWESISLNLIPILKDLWHNVIQPLLPVIGTALVFAVGAALDVFTWLATAVGWTYTELQNGNPIIWALAGAFGFLAAAMAFNAVFNALTVGFTVMRLVTIPSVMASVGMLQAAILAPIAMPAIIIAAAIAALVTVINKHRETQNVIEQTNKALLGNQAEGRKTDQAMKAAADSGKITQEKYQQYLKNTTAVAAQESQRLKDQYSGAVGSVKLWLDNLMGSESAKQYKAMQAKGGGGGWASGGFTGRGGVNDVAGLVHKGEYVLPQSAVDQSTGMPKLEGIMMKNGGGSSSEITIGTINIADQSTADYFIRKLSGNQEITTAGLVPNQKYMGA